MMHSFLAIVVFGAALGVPASGIAQQIEGTSLAAAQEGGEVASLYSSLCASCHGANGHGDGPAAMALNPRPRDFADCGVMTTDSDETLFKAIKDGGPGIGRSPMMPPWGTAISDDQIHGLVRHIRSFCKK
jgi:mono/diheme cytochrome c family protein